MKSSSTMCRLPFPSFDFSYQLRAGTANTVEQVMPGGTFSARFSSQLRQAGTYNAYKWHPPETSFARFTTNAAYSVVHSAGTNSISVDQTTNGANWSLLGTFGFATNVPSSIQITASSPPVRPTVADAVRFQFPTVPQITIQPESGKYRGRNERWMFRDIVTLHEFLRRRTAVFRLRDSRNFPIDSSSHPRIFAS